LQLKWYWVSQICDLSHSQPFSAPTSGENMTHPDKSTSKAGRKSSAGKSKVALQATPSDKSLKQSQLDEISAGKSLAERARKEPRPPCDTDA
jgi:hypothetical protein